MIKRISSKKTYQVVFRNTVDAVSTRVSDVRSISEIAQSAESLCKFIPKEMEVKDIDTGDVSFYSLSLLSYFPREESLY